MQHPEVCCRNPHPVERAVQTGTEGEARARTKSQAVGCPGPPLLPPRPQPEAKDWRDSAAPAVSEATRPALAA